MNEIDNFFDKWEEELQEVKVEEKDSAFMTSVKEMPFYHKREYEEYVRLERELELERERRREYERRRIHNELELERMRSDIERRRIHNKCGCGCETVLDVVQDYNPISILARTPEDSFNQTLTIIFCPKCGRSNRVIGTVISENSIFRPGG